MSTHLPDPNDPVEVEHPADEPDEAVEKLPLGDYVEPQFTQDDEEADNDA